MWTYHFEITTVPFQDSVFSHNHLLTQLLYQYILSDCHCQKTLCNRLLLHLHHFLLLPGTAFHTYPKPQNHLARQSPYIRLLRSAFRNCWRSRCCLSCHHISVPCCPFLHIPAESPSYHRYFVHRYRGSQSPSGFDESDFPYILLYN